jgi:hypothetical protein
MPVPAQVSQVLGQELCARAKLVQHREGRASVALALEPERIEQAILWLALWDVTLELAQGHQGSGTIAARNAQLIA